MDYAPIDWHTNPFFRSTCRGPLLHLLGNPLPLVMLRYSGQPILLVCGNRNLKFYTQLLVAFPGHGSIYQ